MKRQGTGIREQGIDITGQPAQITDPRPIWRRFAGPGLLLLCAAFAILPQMLRGASCGHDFDFHLVSWLDALNSWRHGILYPHWTPSANYGAGEARFMFYPPLTWMGGALLGAWIPWRMVPQIMDFLLLGATGLATRALARQAFNDGVATLAGCAAIFSGYTLFTTYERSAFAEMTGGFWVPLMLCLVLREPKPAEDASTLRSAFDRSALLLALVVAGAWLSNAPLGVMLSYLLAAVALVVAVMAKSWAPVLRAATGAILGLGLSAFFLVPAAWEQRWVAIRQAVDDPGLLIENSWLFARHADPRLELHDIELIRVSGIAVTMVAVALAGLGVSWWRKTLPAERRWWIPLAIIPLAVLLLQFPVSESVWNALPKMRFLQFPWRWLVVLEAPMAIFFASALWAGHRVWRALIVIACCAVFVAATALATVSFFQGCDADDAVSGMLTDYKEGVGFAGTDEYAPPEADNSLVPTSLPFGCLVKDPNQPLGKGDPGTTPDWSADQGSCDAAFEAPRNESPEHPRLQVTLPHSGYLVLRLRAYPAWRLRVNDRAVEAMLTRADGLMAVPVPGGHIDLAIDWTTTRDVIAGRLISAAALALLTFLGLLQYRRMSARLS